MGILVSNVRIENFRSIEILELSLSATNVLIGSNNCGKSNFLKAINVALGQNKNISPEDIYVGKDEVLDKSKCATIDIMIRPVDDANNVVSGFSDFWIGVFTKAWITTGDPKNYFLAHLEYSLKYSDYADDVRKFVAEY